VVTALVEATLCGGPPGLPEVTFLVEATLCGGGQRKVIPEFFTLQKFGNDFSLVRNVDIIGHKNSTLIPLGVND